MEDILRAVILGVVQGLTEFLPISSSGHLIVVRELFGWEFTDNLTFDVALHVGTTIAVVTFFWREWTEMLRRGLARILSREPPEALGPVYDERLLLLIVLASIPTAVFGLIVDAFFEDDLRSPEVVGAMLLVFAAVLFAAERLAGGVRSAHDTNALDAAWVGIAQAVSLIPGVSRSGVTISAGLARGFSRYEAARFSFLLATPAILGAGLLRATQAALDGIGADDIATILAGATVSAVVGWLSIKYLLALLQTGTLLQFIAYRLAAGAFVLAYFAF